MQGVITMRRMSLREKAKIRGERRHLRALRRWVASFEAFFPQPEPHGDGFLWFVRPPVYSGLVSGPRAERWFQRACLVAMLDVVAHLQANKPKSVETWVFAIFTPLDLFGSSVEVAWDATSFRNLTPELPPERSLQREWGLLMRFPEIGTAWEQASMDGKVYPQELWAIGDME